MHAASSDTIHKRGIATFLAMLISLGLAPTRALAARTTLQPIVVPIPCVAPLTLSLRPGPVPGSYNRSWAPARDIPPNPLTTSLPLYPGAINATAAFPDVGFEVLPPAYRKVATASFAVPAALTRVANWYRAAFVPCGFGDGERLPLQRHGSVQFAGSFFTSLKGLWWVSLTYLPVASDRTLVRYVVQTLDLPPRPASSFLYGPFVRVSVYYHSVGALASMNHTFRFTATWPATLARLVAMVNRPMPISVDHLGGAGLTIRSERAVLSFVRADGGIRQVKVGGVFNNVVVGHSRPLNDTNSVLMRLVDRVVWHRCSITRGCA